MTIERPSAVLGDLDPTPDDATPSVEFLGGSQWKSNMLHVVELNRD